MSGTGKSVLFLGKRLMADKLLWREIQRIPGLGPVLSQQVWIAYALLPVLFLEETGERPGFLS